MATFGVGSPVWVEDDEDMWIEATVLKLEPDKVLSKNRNGKDVVSAYDMVHPRDEDTAEMGVDDMTRLSYLHEPGVLDNLSRRYHQNQIYTYTGSICIAINPFQAVPHLVGTKLMEMFKVAQPGEVSQPHVYAVADRAYKAMMDEEKSQSILVSGESGAGKTEATKLIMNYLAFMGGRANPVAGERSVEQKVLESNPLLEAFGNAKTVRNNNSSRFGKFVEIQFNRGKISGAAVRTYLLERSRITQVSTPERSYHCFYQLCAGASAEEREKLKIEAAPNYFYLNQSECFEVPRFDEVEEYNATRHAMDVVGISREEQDGIFKIVASILHLGNVDFKPGKEADSSMIADDKARYHLNCCAELLGADPKSLEDSLIQRIMVTRGEAITKLLDKNQAVGSRDALAKTLYAKMFDWLVDKVNKSIGQDPNSNTLVGVLDIYGFESFTVNSFEQLCINLTNEKLQQHFNTHVFKMEQEEYVKEEINWDNIDFVDNIDVLDLIEKKPLGIIALLDEACMLPKSTPESFGQKLAQSFDKHKRFTKHKFKKTLFKIDHFAGEVEYSTDTFIEKNKDFVIAEHQKLLTASSDPFVREVYPPPEEPKQGGKGGGKSSFSSIGTRFKLQLSSLMETLNQTEPHYVRCVKPNQKLKPLMFEKRIVLQQLRCSGVLEAVRISCAGFPTRRTFFEFADRFKILFPDAVANCNEDYKGACVKILEKIGLERYQIGKTKVFLRAGQMAVLDTKRTEILNEAAKKMTRRVRTFLARNEYLRAKQASVCVQTRWRGVLAFKLFVFLKETRAATEMQRYVRGMQNFKAYREMKAASIRIQAAVRSLCAKNLYIQLQEHKAASIIQANWRARFATKSYHELMSSTILFQSAWRSKNARADLFDLKELAKEIVVLQDTKQKLESRVADLSSELATETKTRMDLEAQRASEVAALDAQIADMRSQAEDTNKAIEKARKLHQENLDQISRDADDELERGLAAELPAEAKKTIEFLKQSNDKFLKVVKAAEARTEEAEEKISVAEKKAAEGLKEMQDVNTAAKALREQKAKEDAAALAAMQKEKQKQEEITKRFETETNTLRKTADKMEGLETDVVKVREETAVAEAVDTTEIEELRRTVADAVEIDPKEIEKLRKDSQTVASLESEAEKLEEEVKNAPKVDPDELEELRAKVKKMEEDAIAAAAAEAAEAAAAQLDSLKEPAKKASDLQAEVEKLNKELAGMVAPSLEASELETIKKEAEKQASTEAAPAADPAELEKLRQDGAKVPALEAEAAGLRAQSQRVTVLEAENKSLQEQLSAAGVTPAPAVAAAPAYPGAPPAAAAPAYPGAPAAEAPPAYPGAPAAAAPLAYPGGPAAAAPPAYPGAPAAAAPPAYPGAPVAAAPPAYPGAPAPVAAPVYPGAPAAAAAPAYPGAPAPAPLPAYPGAPAPAPAPAYPGAPAPAPTPAYPGAPAPAATPACPGAPAPAATPAYPGAPAPAAPQFYPGAPPAAAAPPYPGAPPSPAPPTYHGGQVAESYAAPSMFTATQPDATPGAAPSPYLAIPEQQQQQAMIAAGPHAQQQLMAAQQQQQQQQASFPGARPGTPAQAVYPPQQQQEMMQQRAMTPDGKMGMQQQLGQQMPSPQMMPQQQQQQAMMKMGGQSIFPQMGMGQQQSNGMSQDMQNVNGGAMGSQGGMGQQQTSFGMGGMGSMGMGMGMGMGNNMMTDAQGSGGQQGSSELQMGAGMGGQTGNGAVNPLMQALTSQMGGMGNPLAQLAAQLGLGNGMGQMGQMGPMGQANPLAQLLMGMGGMGGMGMGGMGGNMGMQGMQSMGGMGMGMSGMGGQPGMDRGGDRQSMRNPFGFASLAHDWASRARSNLSRDERSPELGYSMQDDDQLQLRSSQEGGFTRREGMEGRRDSDLMRDMDRDYDMRPGRDSELRSSRDKDFDSRRDSSYDLLGSREYDSRDYEMRGGRELDMRRGESQRRGEYDSTRRESTGSRDFNPRRESREFDNRRGSMGSIREFGSRRDYDLRRESKDFDPRRESREFGRYSSSRDFDSSRRESDTRRDFRDFNEEPESRRDSRELDLRRDYQDLDSPSGRDPGARRERDLYSSRKVSSRARSSQRDADELGENELRRSRRRSYSEPVHDSDGSPPPTKTRSSTRRLSRGDTLTKVDAVSRRESVSELRSSSRRESAAYPRSSTTDLRASRNSEARSSQKESRTRESVSKLQLSRKENPKNERGLGEDDAMGTENTGRDISVVEGLDADAPADPDRKQSRSRSGSSRQLVEQKRRKAALEKLQKDQGLLIHCISQDVGFSLNFPVAAGVVFKSLLHWNSFKSEHTRIFSRVVAVVISGIEGALDNNDGLAYWLSNSTCLLNMMQRTLRFSSDRRRSSKSGIYGSGAGVDTSNLMEAQRPALVFRQQLVACTEKIFGTIRDNLTKIVAPLLPVCLKVQKSRRRSKVQAEDEVKVSNGYAAIISTLDDLLDFMRKNMVFPVLTQSVIEQVFAFINVHMFNSLQMRRECCCYSNGLFVRDGLKQLDHWASDVGRQSSGRSSEKLIHIRQATDFLIYEDKATATLEEITKTVCPDLNMHQLHRIATMYTDDANVCPGLSPEVVDDLADATQDSLTETFLLTDDTSTPFTLDDIVMAASASLEEMMSVEPPQLLADSPSFQFLLSEGA